MSTYLSQPYQGSQFVSGVPLDLVMQVGRQKQTEYNQRESEIQSNLDRISNYQIVKDSDRQVIGDKIKAVVDKMNQFSGMDLTDNSNYNQLMGLTNSIYNDSDVYSRISANKNYLNQVNKLDKIRTEKPDEYSADNERVFQAQANKWLSDPNQKSFNATYTPYYDYTKEQKSLVDEARQNPDIRREIETYTDPVTGNTVKRGEREIKEVTQQRLNEILMGGLSDKAKRQMMIEYQSGMLDKTPESAINEIGDRISSFSNSIRDIQSAMDKGQVPEEDWNTKTNEIKVLEQAKAKHEEMLNHIKATGSVGEFYTPDRYFKDKINSIANGYAYEQKGKMDDDFVFSETFKNQMAKDLDSWKTKNDLEKDMTLGAAGYKGKGKGTGANHGNPGITNEFRDGILSILDKGEGRVSTEGQMALLNASGRMENDGSFTVPVGGKDIMLDVQPTMADANVSVQKAQGIAKFMQSYKDFTRTEQGQNRTIVHGGMPGFVPNPLTSDSDFTYGSKTLPDGNANPTRQKAYDDFIKQGYHEDPNNPGQLVKPMGSEHIIAQPKSVDDFVEAMKRTDRLKNNISGLMGTNVSLKSGIHPEVNKGANIVDDFKNQYGIDINSKEDMEAAKKVASNPDAIAVIDRIGTMLKDKRFSGRLNIVPADGNNTFTGTDGQLYTKGYAQMTRSQLTSTLDGNSKDNLWGIGGDRGLDKLIDDKIITNTHVKDKGGDEIYHVPIVLKVDQDLNTANTNYLRSTRGDAFVNKDLPMYEDDFKNTYSSWELVKNYGKNPTPLIDGAVSKVNSILGTASPALRDKLASLIKSSKNKLAVASSTDKIGILEDLNHIANAETPADLNTLFGLNVKIPGDSAAARNNNPGNIKFSPWLADKYGAKPGSPATDGGRFAEFPDVGSALKAREELLFERSYSRMKVNDAMKRYSNSGYDGEIYPEVKDKRMNELTGSERKQLMRRQLQKEDNVVYNSLIQQGLLD